MKERLSAGMVSAATNVSAADCQRPRRTRVASGDQFEVNSVDQTDAGSVSHSSNDNCPINEMGPSEQTKRDSCRLLRTEQTTLEIDTMTTTKESELRRNQMQYGLFSIAHCSSCHAAASGL